MAASSAWRSSRSQRAARALCAPGAILALVAGACLPSYTVLEQAGGAPPGDGGPGGSASDPTNCGAAGHDCLGGTCVAGICQPVPLLAGLRPEALAASEEAVFFTTTLGVHTCPFWGCGAKYTSMRTLATGAPRAVAVGASGFAAWGFDDYVQQCALPGCDEVVSVADGVVHPTGLAYDGPSLFVAFGTAGAGKILRCPLDGCGFDGAAGTVYAPMLGVPVRMGASSAGVAWVTQSAGAGAVRACPLAGCPTNPATLAAAVSAAALAVAEGDAYFGGLAGDVLRCPLAGCDGTPALVAETPSPVAALTVDATHVYWTETESGRVRRAPRAGGPAETVASDQARPAALALGGGRVCWATLGAAAGATDAGIACAAR